MLQNETPIPHLVAKHARKWTLEAPDDVKESLEFKTLSEKAVGIIEKMRKELGQVVSEATKLSAEHLQRDFVQKYCKFLTFLTGNAIVQLNIRGNRKVLAAIDLIEDKPNDIISV